MKKICLRLLSGILVTLLMATGVQAAETLIPGGQVVGIEIQNGTVCVAAFETNSPAKEAGLLAGDQLVSIDDRKITSTEDVQTALERSSGSVRVTVRRADRLTTFRVEPQISGQGPKLGVYLRQGVSGIGTVTFYDPKTLVFGALGHGVNDGAGQLLTMTQGNIYPARIVSVRKGRTGDPGQLMGSISSKSPLGTLRKNTPQGIFGTGAVSRYGQALPVGSAEQVTTGKAVILSTVTGDTPREYSVEIIKIYPVSRENGRNMLIRVTDPALLELTGGIVQGMSGSPIIQDGKLVGAVTHV